MKYSLLFLLLMTGEALALTITTEDYPPFNIVDSKSQDISGIATEKVSEIMRRSRENYTLTAYPWIRAYQLALKERDTCVFSTTRTPEREPLFKWVGPLVKNNWYIFARAGDNRRPKNINELKPYPIGTYRGDAINDYLLKNGFKTDQAKADEDNPKKLMSNRFDFWATGELIGLAVIKRKKLTNKIVPVLLFHQTELYLACNINFEQAKIDLYNSVLQEMDRDGTNLTIENRYR